MMRSGPTVRVRRRRDWELGPLGKKVVTWKILREVWEPAFGG